MTAEEILAAVDKIGIKKQWHSYAQLPSFHSFATYHKANITFSGSDIMAEMKKYPLRVTFFYKEYYNDEDMKKEAEFEELCRPAVNFTKEMDYDSENKCFYSQYIFNITEFLD